MTLLSFGQPSDGIVQLGFAVEDLDVAMRHYSALLNVAPWTVIEHTSIPGTRYRGRPAAWETSVAFGWAGHMQIELVQQLDDNPSVYTAVPAERRYGFHHWGVATTNFDGRSKELQAQGYAVAAEFYIEGFGAHGAFMETAEDTHALLELIEMTPAVEGFFTDTWNASRDWDGANSSE